MDGWMTCDFTSFLKVFQSYQDDVRMIMKGCVQWNSVYGWEDFTSSEDRTRSARSVGQRLTHWATGAPSHLANTWTIRWGANSEDLDQFVCTCCVLWWLLENSDQFADMQADSSDSVVQITKGVSWIIKGYFSLLLHKNIGCDPSLEPFRWDGSDEWSQHKFSLRSKKNYPWIILNYSCYPFLSGSICEHTILRSLFQVILIISIFQL